MLKDIEDKTKSRTLEGVICYYDMENFESDVKSKVLAKIKDLLEVQDKKVIKKVSKKNTNKISKIIVDTLIEETTNRIRVKRVENE